MNEARQIVLWATGIVAALIVVGSIVLAFSLMLLKAPNMPGLNAGNSTTEQEVKAKEIANYKELVTTLHAQKTNIFEFAVLKGLLPLFNALIASVLTYIFANKALEAFRTYTTRKYKDGQSTEPNSTQASDKS